MGIENKKTRQSLDSIPGVRRGFGFPEARADQSAARIRATYAEERSDLIVLDLTKHADFLNMKVLSSDGFERALWVPRYDPVSGEIYTSRYDTPATTITENRKQRLVAESSTRYKILKKPPYAKEINLESFPLSWSIARLVPQKLLSIEDALRQQDEILHDYKVQGTEFAKVESILGEIRALSVEFIQDQMTDEDFSNLGVQVEEIFSQHGLENAVNPVWQSIVDKIRKAVQKDRLDRNNPSRSRIILASTVLDAVTREVTTGLVREKTSKVYGHLLREREIERAHLAWVKDRLERNKRAVLKHYQADPKRITDDRINSFRNSLKNTLTILDSLRVSPYLQIASLVKAILYSNQFKNKAESERIYKQLSTYKLVGILATFKGNSAEDKMMQRQPQEVVQALDWGSSLISNCLEDPSNADIKVF